MLTQHAIEELAERIERAYRRRQPHWRLGCSNPRVWSAAASALLQLHGSDPTIPIDPELYVAAQPITSPLSDPWADLTEATAARRYRRRVHQIIRKLRAELRAEVQLAEWRVAGGEAIEAVLRWRSRVLSPLGRYIVAFRAGRPDLSERFRSTAQAQHRACPLYRQACRRLLPGAAYPGGGPPPGTELAERATLGLPIFSLN